MSQTKHLPALLAVSLLFPLIGCSPAADTGSSTQNADAATEEAAEETSNDFAARAEVLTQETILVDTHVDVPYRLFEKDEDISQATESGDFDYPRAKKGGLNAPFMSIYVPADFQKTGGAKDHADQLIDMVESWVEASPDKFAIARSPDEVEAQFAEGLISFPLGMENGAPVEGDLANLQHFFDRGIRYITLTHGENNHISDSSYASEREWNGLSPFGEEVVAEMNRLGVMVDVSHISDAAFDKVMEVTKAPVIASHSSCRKFTPDFERNMSDDMIVKLAENGGVIHINFGSSFLLEEIQKTGSAFWAAAMQFAKENGITDQEDPRAKEFVENYRKENPQMYAELSDVVDHIDHVVQLVGIDHVGIGSDYDGVGDSLPTDLKDVSQYPNLVAALLEKGYSDDDVRKILSGNVMRVWRQVEAVAAEMQSAE